MTTDIRVAHAEHGLGSFDRLVFPIGEAMAGLVDFDDGIKRRVALTEIRTLPSQRRMVEDDEVLS